MTDRPSGDSTPLESLPANESEPVGAWQRPKRSRVRKAVRALAIALAGLVVVAAAAAGLAWRWYQSQLDEAEGLGSSAHVEIPFGTSTHEIGDLLERSEVIGDARAWRLYVRLENVGPFQAGEYRMKTGMGVRAAASALANGPTILYERLLAPPGLTIEEVADRVGQLDGRNAQEFLALARSRGAASTWTRGDVPTLEGLLFPDTYYVTEEDDEAAILGRMTDRFDQVASEIDLTERAAALGITPYEAVIIASLIQTEAGTAEDGPKIAAVIYNRLGASMPLQIDATVLYALGVHRTRITPDDLATDSPFNTYQVTGLPPTPISSVTRAALEAALNPADADYLYYVLAGEDGHHAFSATYEEFLVNKRAAREKGLLG